MMDLIEVGHNYHSSRTTGIFTGGYHTPHMGHLLGAVHNLCQRPKGGGGVCKMLKMADKGGGGGKENADIG